MMKKFIFSLLLCMGMAAHAQESNVSNISPISSISREGDISKVSAVNDFWNKSIKAVPEAADMDVWQNPIETWSSGQGDCEDFAIAKYYHLLSMGYNADNLKLAWILLDKDYYDKRKKKVDTLSHMVLFYVDENKQTWVLDNFFKEMMIFEKRPDIAALRAVFGEKEIHYYLLQNEEQPPKWKAILKNTDSYLSFMKTTSAIAEFPFNPLQNKVASK